MTNSDLKVLGTVSQVTDKVQIVYLKHSLTLFVWKKYQIICQITYHAIICNGVKQGLIFSYKQIHVMSTLNFWL